jgi:membrane-associated phospholipid phosphatase
MQQPAIAARRYGEALRNRDPRTLTVTLLVAGLGVALIAFANIVEDYLDHEAITRWDVHFARWLHEHASHPLVQFFNVITYGGNAVAVFIVVVSIGIVLLRRARPNEAALIAFAFAGAVLVNGALKLVFKRPRPELSFTHLDTYSFPSGHAAVSSATFTVIAYLLARRYRTTWARALIVVGTVLAVGLVGFSRLYLGAHYLSDVLAGICVGFAWAMISLIVYTLWAERNVLDLLPARLRR